MSEATNMKSFGTKDVPNPYEIRIVGIVVSHRDVSWKGKDAKVHYVQAKSADGYKAGVRYPVVYPKVEHRVGEEVDITCHGDSITPIFTNKDTGEIAKGKYTEFCFSAL